MKNRGNRKIGQKRAASLDEQEQMPAVPEICYLQEQMQILQLREESLQKTEAETWKQRETLERMQKSLQDWAALLIRREEQLQRREKELQELQKEIADSREAVVELQKQASYTPGEVRRLREQVENLQEEIRALTDSRRVLLRLLYEKETEEREPDPKEKEQAAVRERGFLSRAGMGRTGGEP